MVPILEENERIALLHVHAADVALALEQFAHLVAGGVRIQVAHEDGTLGIDGLLSAPAVPITIAVPVPLTTALTVTFPVPVPVPVPVSIRVPVAVTIGTTLASFGTAIHLSCTRGDDCKTLRHTGTCCPREKAEKKSISWI